ncbi:MAG: PmoA family protein [Maribacter sp.]|nr:PmoA family protein [Maribacter sp.]
MKFYIVFIFILLLSCTENEDIVRFSIENKGVETPIELDINGIGLTGAAGDMTLFRNAGETMNPIPFQLDTIGAKRILFMSGNQKDGEYILKRKKNSNAEQSVQAIKEKADLTLSLGNKNVLSYRYGMTYPPKGVDSIYGKSGYIHPVITPLGDTLSRIQPPDHFHHYGIWGPWTHTQIKGQQVDFWNLGDRKGTVLFKKFNSMLSGPVFGSFNAVQEHIDFITEKEAQVALNENLNVTVWDLNREDRYMFDYISSFNSPLDEGILFEAYRYGGGVGMRFTERWKADNCSVLTSEGNDRLTADGTNAKWCIVKGESSDGKGTNGILFMSHTENRMHPEPMRIWPIDGNGGRGDMFFEFCPIRHEEWKIEPGKDYQLKYRMVVFEGDLTAEEAEAYWQSFVNKPQINIVNN